MTLACLVALVACNGGGGGTGTVSAVGGAAGGGTAGVVVSGGGADGPVAGGRITLATGDGEICGEALTGDDATYSLLLTDRWCAPPWLATLDSGYDMVRNESNSTRMLALSMDADAVPLRVNVTPMSTIIYYAALAAAGDGATVADIAGAHVDVAAVTRAVVRACNFGMAGNDPDFDPVRFDMGTGAAVSFVKSNEALIEAVRRTALDLNGGLNSAGIDSVLWALGEDLADGLLDGRGPAGAVAGGTDLTALWHLHSAAVAMEWMAGEPRITLDTGGEVTGGAALDALSVAAEAVVGEPVTAADLLVLGADSLFVSQAREAAAAAVTLSGDPNGQFAAFAAALDALAGKTSDEGTHPAATVAAALTAAGVAPSAAATEERAAADDLLTGSLPASRQENALAAARAVRATSTLVAKSSREVYVEWSYPGTSLQKGGFRIYRRTASGDQLVCSIPNPAARSTAGYESECRITAGPGDTVRLFMTAYDTAHDQESAPTAVYEQTIPEPRFTVDPVAASCPAPFVFDASASTAASGSLLTYDWFFDDGATETGISPDHLFPNSGTYGAVLTLTATEPTGVFSASAQAKLDILCR